MTSGNDANIPLISSSLSRPGPWLTNKVKTPCFYRFFFITVQRQFRKICQEILEESFQLYKTNLFRSKKGKKKLIRNPGRRILMFFPDVFLFSFGIMFRYKDLSFFMLKKIVRFLLKQRAATADLFDNSIPT